MSNRTAVIVNGAGCPTTEKPRKSAVRKCQDALIEAEKRRLDSAIQGKAGQS